MKTTCEEADKRGGKTRRQILAATAVGVAAGALGGAAFQGVDTASAQVTRTIYVRDSLASLHSNSPDVASLRRGIAVMKTRPFEDPTSWSYQAAIHGLGFAPPAGLPQQMVEDMAQCVHGARAGGPRHFLPWHRMYLHFFERIVRSASGDPSFSLPYWNYSALGGSALPRPFRVPADFTNPLFERQRRAFSPNVNAGEALPFNFVDDRVAMSQLRFNDFSDRLEGTPHGAVHVAVGGQGGLMSSVPTSAQDPIFWVHHCNIDRMWSRWLTDMPGASNPTDDPIWMARSWAFYDENGDRQIMSVSDVLDSENQLGYLYDDELPPVAGLDPWITFSSESGGLELTLASAGGGVTLSGAKATVAAEVDSEAESGGAGAFATERGDDGSARPVILRLEGLSYDEAPGVIYEIYVNMPEGETADAAGPYYAGLVAPFGFERSEAPLEIDITGLLNRQIENELFLGGEVQVTFIPAGVPENAAESGMIIPELTVESISVIRK